MLNNIILIGRLVADPELRKTQISGTSVCSFTLAVQRSYSTEKKVDFIDCEAWANTADFIAKYVTKGQLIAVQGNLQINTYTDKEGNSRKAAKVVVRDAEFCGAKEPGTGEAAGEMGLPF